MNERNQNYLFNKYPNIFKHYKADKGTKIIDVGDGWFNLIDRLCTTFKIYVDSIPDSHIYIHKISKEYGVLGCKLCVLLNDDNQGLADKNTFLIKTSVMQSFKAKSLKICEHCGKEAEWEFKGNEYSVQLRTDYHQVLCNYCYDKLKEDENNE